MLHVWHPSTLPVISGIWTIVWTQRRSVSRTPHLPSLTSLVTLSDNLWLGTLWEPDGATYSMSEFSPNLHDLCWASQLRRGTHRQGWHVAMEATQIRSVQPNGFCYAVCALLQNNLIFFNLFFSYGGGSFSFDRLIKVVTRRFSTEFEYNQVQFHLYLISFAGPIDPVSQFTSIFSNGINIDNTDPHIFYMAIWKNSITSKSHLLKMLLN